MSSKAQYTSFNAQIITKTLLFSLKPVKLRISSCDYRSIGNVYENMFAMYGH